MPRSIDSYSGEERQPLVLEETLDSPESGYAYPPSTRHLQNDRRRSRSIRDYLFLLTSISTLITSALAFYVFVKNGMHDTDPPPRVLRRPNPYPNLHKILRNATNATFPPISNFPEIVLQIDNSDPQRRIREDDKGKMTPDGAVYPHYRHILVSPETSTILHFRHLDFAMEDCVLQWIPPAELSKVSAPFPMIDLWLLASSTEMSPWFPESWHSAPNRVRRLGSMLLSDSPTNITRFDCPSNEFTTLELSCAQDSPSCKLDFWQNKLSKSQSGISIVQHSTHTKFQVLD